MQQFLEDLCSGEAGGDWEKTTPTACIGGAALQGRSTFGGLFKDLVRMKETRDDKNEKSTERRFWPLGTFSRMSGHPLPCHAAVRFYQTFRARCRHYFCDYVLFLLSRNLFSCFYPTQTCRKFHYRRVYTKTRQREAMIFSRGRKRCLDTPKTVLD